MDGVAIKRWTRVAVGSVAAVAMAQAAAGHGGVHVPSFYPQEIDISTIDPTAAGVQLEKNTLNAYVGAAPRFQSAPTKALKAVESLESFLVLDFNPTSTAFKQSEKRCAKADAVFAALDRNSADVTLSLYPVTPFHPDYLQYADRVEERQARARAQPPASPALRFRAEGTHAEALVQPHWKLDRGRWDVSLEEVPVESLTAAAVNGWIGPPWMKQGWYQAYRLLAPAVRDPQARRSADALYERLVAGAYKDATERMNLARQLLTNLTHGCERVVLGYTVRHEYYNDSFSGIENISFDSQLGLNSPMFIRSVKLKDFPWNGWLYLGTKDRPEAAWNPVAGFTDAPGRLLWSVIGDPAEIPYNGNWVPNRVQAEVERAAQSPGLQVPSDALRPQAGTGTLERIGDGKSSTARIRYRVPASRFDDGTSVEVADLLYPYMLAFRWGAKASDNRNYDPVIDASTSWMRKRLVALKVLRVDRGTRDIAADIQVPIDVPIVDVYVDYAALDSPQVAALAPPWSAVPWHVLVLMEEAVQRRLAAFSKEQAQRLGVPWLDLARDASLQARLRGLIDEFEKTAYRPAALQDLVTAEAARERWRALKKFAIESKHLLVSNGPYRLTQWSATSAVAQVNREYSYPNSVGSFDHYAYPPRALITQVKREGNRVLIYAEVEKVAQELRNYTIVREPLTRTTLRGLFPIRSVCRYVILGPDGAVVYTGAAGMKEDGRFVVELPPRLPHGRYTFMVGINLDESTVKEPTRVLSFEVRA